MRILNYNLKIGAQLLALFLIFAILPTTIVTGIIINYNNSTVNDATNSIESTQINGLAFQYAQTVNSWIDRESQLIQSLSQEPTLRIVAQSLATNASATSLSESSSLLNSWAQSQDSINDLILSNYSNGNVIVSATKVGDSNITTNRSTDPGFIGAKKVQGTSLQTDDFSFTDIYYSTTENEFSLEFSMVIRPINSDSANPTMILIERVDPNFLWDLLSPRDSNGQPIGTFYTDSGLGNSGEILLVNSNGLAISRSRFTLIDSNFILKESFANSTGYKSAELNGFNQGIEIGYNGMNVFGAYIYLGYHTQQQDKRETTLVNKMLYDLSWVLVVRINKDEVLQPVKAIQNELNSSLETIFLIILAIGLIVVAISIFVARSFSRPINNLSKISQSISLGDLTVNVNKSNKDDEIGDLQNSFYSMVEFLKPSIKIISDNARSLSSSAQELASSSEEVNASSEEMSSVSQQISKGAQEQSEFLTKSSNQMEELRKEFNEKIGNISIASDVIENISNQVNLLALNASIEAARAGEYGRGFAVVSENIRRLADEAKGSVSQVNSIINDLTNSIAKNIATVSSTLAEVTSVAEETTSGAEEASASIEEQSATMEELSASAQELARISTNLEEIVHKFKID